MIMSGLAHAAGQLHEVAMLNIDPDDPQQRMVFKPAVLRVQPGDTVKFVATDRGHNAQSIDDMSPEGADDFRGRINEEIEVTLDVAGTYGYVCQPHQAAHSDASGQLFRQHPVSHSGVSGHLRIVAA